MNTNDELDPKGLVRDSFLIENITSGQCRSIFLDWALSLPEAIDSKDAITALLVKYETQYPNHPMTDVMQSGIADMGRPKRRGGWRSRPR